MSERSTRDHAATDPRATGTLERPVAGSSLRRRSLVARSALAWALASSLSHHASAHAPPQASGVYDLSTSAGLDTWIRTNRGLVIKPKAGSPMLLCNDAYQAVLSETPPVATLRDGVLVATYDAGLVHISPDGCLAGSVSAPLNGRTVSALAQAKDGQRVFAALDPTSGLPGGLLVSDDGHRWEQTATFQAYVTAMAVAPSDPLRLYATAQLETVDGSPAHTLLVSTDGGSSFQNRPIMLLNGEARAFLVAIDPDDNHRLFLRTLARNPNEPERLLVSDDGGLTYRTLAVAVGPLTFALEAGSAWLGAKAGLSHSVDDGETFTPVPGAPSYVGCIVPADGAASVCGFLNNEFGVFRGGPSADSFTAELRFPEVVNQVRCAPDAPVLRACKAGFADWLSEQAGTPDGGTAGSDATPEGNVTSDTDPAGMNGDVGAGAVPGAGASAEAPSAGRGDEQRSTGSVSCSHASSRKRGVGEALLAGCLLLTLGLRRRRLG
jgi:hypothetical protein